MGRAGSPAIVLEIATCTSEFVSSSAEHSDAMSPEVMAAKSAAHAAKVAALEESLTDLAHENAMLERRLFGMKSERIQTSELQLALGDLLVAEAKLQAVLDASIDKAKDAVRDLRSPKVAQRSRSSAATARAPSSGLR